MDSDSAAAAFHKPSNDPSNRKYRRRSPASASSSDGERSVHERSSTPTREKDERRDIDRDHHRNRYSSRDGGSNRRSYNDRRRDDYKKREKYAEEDHKNYYKLSPHTRGGCDHSRRESEQSRSRDGSGHRSKYKKDDEKRSSWRDSKELDDMKYTRFEKGKSYDQETRGVKDRYFKEPRQLLDDQSVATANKSNFSVGKDTEYTNDASKHVHEVQSSSSKQGQELAAQVAAMKAAELVNRNLIGTGAMSTDQKKKLLWGSKKTTPTQEVAHRWDTSMFSDRERQEKFNKLMGVKVEPKPEIQNSSLAEKQKELQMDLEKQYTAGLRRRDGRTVGLGL
ncbi:putative small acidic protein [Helianthus debilis subsp. tardiflorus]